MRNASLWALIMTGTIMAPALAEAPAELLPALDPRPAPRATLGLPSSDAAAKPVQMKTPGQTNIANKTTAWERELPLPPGPPAVPWPPSSYTGNHATLPRPVSAQAGYPQAGCYPQPNNSAAPGYDCDVPMDSCKCSCCPCLGNFSFFAGFNGASEPVDMGINSNVGYRLAVNLGLPVCEELGIGVQIGTAINHGNSAMRFTRYIDGTTERTESFTTVGIFQRTECGLNYGIAYDFRFDDYFEDINVSQWRWQVGFQMGPNDEIGVWGTIADHTDEASYAGSTFALRPINQWNLFWRHVWQGDIMTRLWVGLAEEHGRFNLFVSPREAPVKNPFTFGGEVFVPLTDCMALYGEAHCITPNDTGVITATIGFAFYPGTARGAARSRFAPLFPLANNTSFGLDLQQ